MAPDCVNPTNPTNTWAQRPLRRPLRASRFRRTNVSSPSDIHPARSWSLGQVGSHSLNATTIYSGAYLRAISGPHQP
ncbi:MAG: hypothetical protein K0U66_09690, partial [Gammaproteobacteria bacterium]|nr:hypothetical protein [Gammaproteobacteria bacterium]